MTAYSIKSDQIATEMYILPFMLTLKGETG